MRAIAAAALLVLPLLGVHGEGFADQSQTTGLPVADYQRSQLSLAESVAAWGDRLALEPGADAPIGLQNLREIARQEPTQPPDQNSSANQTVLGQAGAGTQTHHHGNLDDQGLAPVWVAAFLGAPSTSVAADVDGDGTEDLIQGTSVAIVAISGADASMLWAHHIGSRVSGLAVTDRGGDGSLEIAYSTWWEGQTPRIGLLDARSGHSLWFTAGLQPFLGIGLTHGGADADILAATLDGMVGRYSIETGELQWEIDANIPPEVDDIGGVAGLGVLTNEGQYLMDVGDLNGDGVNDVATATFHFSLTVFNEYTIVNAIDGTNGDRLWTRLIGGDPAFAHFAILHDLDMLDARGDGSFDVAYVGEEFRLHYLGATFIVEADSFYEVIDGSSDTLGAPIAIRKIPCAAPLTCVQIESFFSVDHTDADGDGMDEIVVIRRLVTDGLVLDDVRFRLERFALPPSAPGSTTDLVLSPWTTTFNGFGLPILEMADVDGDGRRDAIVAAATIVASEDIPAAYVVEATGDIATEYLLEFSPTGIGFAGGKLAPGSPRSVELIDIATGEMSSLPMRGAPTAFAAGDADRDGTEDLFVGSTDNQVHIVDGISGQVTNSIPVSGGIEHMIAAPMSNGTIILAAWQESFRRGVDAINAGTGGVIYSIPKSGVFFDDSPVQFFDGNGDGVPDFIGGADVFDDTVVAINGVNGRTLWTVNWPAEQNSFYLFDDEAGAASFGGAGDDLVITGFSQMLAISGTDGALRWSQNYNLGAWACQASFDADGDGKEQLLIWPTSGGNPTIVGATGAGAALPLLEGNNRVIACDLQAVNDGFRASQDLLVTASYIGIDGSGATTLVGRFNVERGWIWQQETPAPAVANDAVSVIGADPTSLDGGRVFTVYQDHVFAKRWSDGSHVGEFAVNGPFVRDGFMLDLDGFSPAEVAILSTDGLLWALSEDAPKVLGRLHNEAVAQGKDTGALLGGKDAADQLGDGAGKKRSPAPGLALLAWLAALVVIRRR